jgi:16S rRNA (cytidine1402-2'-O)-methyltransferase
MLYIIPTPIGNLEDITFRAIKILKISDIIISEDTRVSKKILNHYNIYKPIKSYHKYNEHIIMFSLIKELTNNKIISLISDCGTPSISDPGFLLIRSCIKHNIKIECLPGPTAFVPALVMSGLPINEFIFLGFIQSKKRNLKFKELKFETKTSVFYESPHKLLKTLYDLKQYIKHRKIIICREISKKFEQIIRGNIKNIILFFENKKPLGEIVVVIEGN